jgi:AcrR family transcriptional regulator
MGKKDNTEAEYKILEAARKVFIKKGYAGARMREIADEAGINKGLLHYYFKTKDGLFESIFDELLMTFAPQLNIIFESDLPFFEKIEQFINQYMTVLINNPDLPSFIVHEMQQNEEKVVNAILKSKHKPNPMKFMMQIQMEVATGKIRAINPVHLMINMVSLCAFPFVGKPMFKGMLHINDVEYLQIMEIRKKEIVDFIINSLKI